MFSGIVESVQPILSSEKLENAFRIEVQKPTEFDDLKIGDSIACDGICLTVEYFDSNKMTFALAAETIRTLHWQSDSWIGRRLNLERSLRFGDRIHGHLVTGHVDSLGQIQKTKMEGESFFIDIKVAPTVLPYVWKKGSVTLNGVSLTVNDLNNDMVSVCLIPETLKRTNLGQVKAGQLINVEPDYMARAIQRSFEVRNRAHGI